MQQPGNQPSRTRNSDGTLRIDSFSENAGKRVLCKYCVTQNAVEGPEEQWRCTNCFEEWDHYDYEWWADMMLSSSTIPVNRSGNLSSPQACRHWACTLTTTNTWSSPALGEPVVACIVEEARPIFDYGPENISKPSSNIIPDVARTLPVFILKIPLVILGVAIGIAIVGPYRAVKEVLAARRYSK